MPRRGILHGPGLQLTDTRMAVRGLCAMIMHTCHRLLASFPHASIDMDGNYPRRPATWHPQAPNAALPSNPHHTCVHAHQIARQPIEALLVEIVHTCVLAIQAGRLDAISY